MERFIKSADGAIDLHLFDLGPRDADLAVLCLHGFTRNAADFEVLSAHLAKRYRVLVPSQRGRGKSGWDQDAERYQPATYAADMFALLDHLAIERIAIIGTSMGGIIAMVMASMQPERLVSVVLNDIGTEMTVAGIRRLYAMLGDRKPPADWDEAVTKTRQTNISELPDYSDADWQTFTRRLYREADGVPVPAYDPAILNALDGMDPNAPPPDLWTLWPGLEGMPVLVVRGALSEIITADTLGKMRARHSRLTSVTVPHRGHAPMLDEPVAMDAIDTFLATLDAHP
jgi:pimeloyl-ACP methyl ester carboxylesterase